MNAHGYSLFDEERSGILTPRGDRPEPNADLIANGSYVRMLRRAINSAMLERAPYHVVELFEHGAWRTFADDSTYKVYEYARLDDFVEAEPPAGLGRPGGAGALRALIYPYAFDPKVKMEPEQRQLAIKAVQLIDAETEPCADPHARPGNQNAAAKDENAGNNITRVIPDRPDRGTSETYLLRRLKRDRPELAERVVKREISAHAAACEAGFRQRLVQVAPTVEGYVKSAQKHLTPAEQRDVAHTLLGALNEMKENKL